MAPRGALDLAAAFHRAADSEMVRRLEGSDLSRLKFRERVAWAVLDRRIDDVMRIEKLKSAARKAPAARLLLAGPRLALSVLKAPQASEPPVGRWPGRAAEVKP